MAKIMDNQSPHYTEMLTTVGIDHPAGELLLNSLLYIFPFAEVKAGQSFVGVVKSPKVLAIKAAVPMTSGHALYYNVGTKNVTTTSTGNVLVGFANKSALQTDSHVEMLFDGTLNFITS